MEIELKFTERINDSLLPEEAKDYLNRIQTYTGVAKMREEAGLQTASLIMANVILVDATESEALEFAKIYADIAKDYVKKFALDGLRVLRLNELLRGEETIPTVRAAFEEAIDNVVLLADADEFISKYQDTKDENYVLWSVTAAYAFAPNDIRFVVPLSKSSYEYDREKFLLERLHADTIQF